MMILHKRLEGKRKGIEKQDAFRRKKWKSIMRNNDSAVLFASNHAMASTSVKASLEICYPYSQTHKSTWSDGEGEQVAT